MQVGYHASHEQKSPRALLEYTRRAEEAGFDAAMCSDHFHPWSERQGESGFAWSWLGAALQATALSFGTVCAPGYRYHPAIIAQAAATLQQMYEGRFWLALGSGEALNEHITGDPWPNKDERNARLEECAQVIRRLLAGERVDHDGLVRVADARLYTRPTSPVPLYAAALTPETAEWAAGWADGLITAAPDADTAAELMEAFRRGGGAGHPVLIQLTVSYANSEEQAIAAAHDQWRQLNLEPPELGNLPSPAAFDAATAEIPPERTAQGLLTSPDPGDHVRLLRSFAETGVDAVYVHNVSLEEDGFIDLYREHVLPALSGR